MGNNLEIIVSLAEFEAEQDTNKKLNMMFKSHCAQQLHCKEVVDIIHRRIDGISVPKKLNKTKIAGVGIGGSGLTALIIKGPELLREIGSWFQR